MFLHAERLILAKKVKTYSSIVEKNASSSKTTYNLTQCHCKEQIIGKFVSN